MAKAVSRHSGHLGTGRNLDVSLGGEGLDVGDEVAEGLGVGVELLLPALVELQEAPEVPTLSGVET